MEDLPDTPPEIQQKLDAAVAEEEKKRERITKAQKDVWVPSEVARLPDQNIDPLLVDLRPYTALTPVGRFRPDKVVVPPIKLPSALVYTFTELNPTLFKDLNATYADEFKQRPETMPAFIAYRDDAVTLASNLASGQVFRPWIYNFAITHCPGSDRCSCIQARTWCMIAEYELFGAIDLMPIPDSFVKIQTVWMGKLTGDQYEQDKYILELNKYEGAIVIPATFTDELLPLCGSLVMYQLMTNWICGFRVFQGLGTKVVIQVSGQGSEWAILASTGKGNWLFATKRGTWDDLAMIPACIFFNKGSVEYFNELNIPDYNTLVCFLEHLVCFFLEIAPPENPIAYELTKGQQRPNPPMDITSNFILKRLEMLKMPVHVAMHVPLPMTPYYHLPERQRDALLHVVPVLGSLYGKILEAIGPCMNSPMSNQLFRWDRGDSHLATVLVNTTPYDNLQYIAESLANPNIYGGVKPMGVFIYEWVSKRDRPSDVLSVKQKKKADPGVQYEEWGYMLLAPPGITVIIILLGEISAGVRVLAERKLRDRIPVMFKLGFPDYDFVSLDDAGSISNIFTRSAAATLSKVYKTAHYVPIEHVSALTEYINGWNQSNPDQTPTQRITVKVKEGLDRGFTGNTLLSFVEREHGSCNRNLIIQTMLVQMPYAPRVNAERPPFPMDRMPESKHDYAKLTDNQIVIQNFIDRLVRPGTEDALRDHRNLLICGAPRTYKTSFAYFLAKYFVVYWKGVGIRGGNTEFWAEVPPDTKLIIVDEWDPQESDFTWMNKVGEGSEHNVSRKFKDPEAIKAGVRILILTNRSEGEIKTCATKNLKQKQGRGETENLIWEAFTRRFAIVYLTGRAVSRKMIHRVDTVQRCYSIDELPTSFSGIAKKEISTATEMIAELTSLKGQAKATKTKGLLKSLLMFNASHSEFLSDSLTRLKGGDDETVDDVAGELLVYDTQHPLNPR